MVVILDLAHLALSITTHSIPFRRDFEREMV